MIDDVSDIIAMYDRDPDNEHQRLERHQLEHELTWRTLDWFLPPEGSILEICSAQNNYYSHEPTRIYPRPVPGFS